MVEEDVEGEIVEFYKRLFKVEANWWVEFGGFRVQLN